MTMLIDEKAAEMPFHGIHLVFTFKMRLDCAAQQAEIQQVTLLPRCVSHATVQGAEALRQNKVDE